MQRLRMARYYPRRFRGRDIFVQLPCAAHPLSNDYQSFDRIRWNYTTSPRSIQAAVQLYARQAKSVTVRSLSERLLERGDHAGDTRLHLANRRGGNAHRTCDRRAVVARLHESTVYLPRLL